MANPVENTGSRSPMPSPDSKQQLYREGEQHPKRIEQKRRSPSPRWRKPLGVGASVVLLVLIIVGVIPRFASYSGAWAHMSNLGTWWWAAIAIGAVVTQISGVWIYQAALPGLRLRHGFLETETTIAISSTVPAGGAVAVGMTYKMFSSFGFADLVISTAVITTGIWNLAAKFGLPVVGVALLAINAHPTGEALGAAIGGVVIMIVGGFALWLEFRSETSARWLGRLADGVVNRTLRLFHKPATDRIERSLLRFRIQTVDIVHRRGWLLTWAALGGQFAAVGLVLTIVRGVGITSAQVSFAAVLTSFAVARLVGALPVTPGGLGTVDATFTGMLTAFGAKSPQALAADLIWRLTTYFLPILLGIVTYIMWVRWEQRSATTRANARSA
jgi:putative heme transporter